MSEGQTPAEGRPSSGPVRRALAFVVDVVAAGLVGAGGVLCAWYATGTDPREALGDGATAVYLGVVWVVALAAYLGLLGMRAPGKRLLGVGRAEPARPLGQGRPARVREREPGQAAEAAPSPLVRLVASQIGELGAAEVDSVRRFVEGRGQLGAEARRDLARRLAESLRRQIPALSPADCPDEEVLLGVVYAALRLRRADGSSPSGSPRPTA